MELEYAVCPLWPIQRQRRLDGSHYAGYYGKCSECDRKIVVSRVLKRRIDDKSLKLLCEQCGLKKESGE